MNALDSESIDLVVTSPPYPMIEMWDPVFSEQSDSVKTALLEKDGSLAFERMHQELDAVWDETVRVLKHGGFACINIGDAARTINGNFQLYPNHARILTSLCQKGLSPLPAIIWRKQTNAPNKFMGSGVLPAGAYVTLEHEYILILRKGGKRIFGAAEDRSGRQSSAIFWEERNQWFSDVWMDLKGVRQDTVDKSVRKRSGAYPFELPYRLINMYSVKGDTVLDPFLGMGTTMLAAMAACRNSAGFEIDHNFEGIIDQQVASVAGVANQCINDRLQRHEAFVKDRIQSKGPIKYTNIHYGFPVIMNQETNLVFNPLTSIRKSESGSYKVSYASDPGAVTPVPLDHSGEPVRKNFQQLTLKL